MILFIAAYVVIGVITGFLIAKYIQEESWGYMDSTLIGLWFILGFMLWPMLTFAIIAVNILKFIGYVISGRWRNYP